MFLDSNVLIYAYSDSDPAKRARARALADQPGAVISTQVLSELANVLLKKFGLSVPDTRSRATEVAARCEIVVVTPSIVLEALRIHERYGFGFFDSQIVASALAGGASVLFTEDLHDGQTVDATLSIRSPFSSRAEPSRAAYRALRKRRAARRS
jgi:predicted nucleic acid-binding protein